MADINAQQESKMAVGNDVAPTTSHAEPVTADAVAALNNERQMSVRDSFRFWPKAIGFSFIISLAIIMEGYDTNLMSNFYAYPSFRERFGDETDSEGELIISAQWQTIISNGVQVGSILGLILNGYINEWLGYRWTMQVAMLAMIGAVFIPFFSTGLPMFLAGAIVQGLPWGVFQTLAVTYAADICPMSLRGYMTSWINICWVLGQLISMGILNAFLGRTDQWSYRIPFALQWLWPIPIMIGTYFAPESPWWLIRHGREEEARRAITSLTSPKSGVYFDLDAQIEMMKTTNQFEIEVQTGTQYWDCFRRTDLRRTEIACLTWVVQAFCGVPFMAFGIQFMEQAGMGTTDAYRMSLGQNGISLIGCFIAWYIMTHVGRRTMYVYGLTAIFVILMIVGFMGIPRQTDAIAWAIGCMIIFMLFCFQLSVGPACYTLVSEMPSTRLRVKTVALSRASYNASGFIVNAIMPQLVGRNALNLGAKGAFFWAGVTLIFLTWTFFRLPETFGLTFSELDLLFEHKVSARKFNQETADALKPHLQEVADRREKTAVADA